MPSAERFVQQRERQMTDKADHILTFQAQFTQAMARPIACPRHSFPSTFPVHALAYS